MWEEAQIKANVGLKQWSRLWLTQNKYINHWKPLRLSLDLSWSVSLWMQGCARRPCALSGALCESTSNKNSLIVRFSRDWTIPLWRTYFQQTECMYVKQSCSADISEMWGFHPAVIQYVYPRDSGYMFTPALWRKQRCSFLHWWMWVLTNILWQKRLKQCMILLTAKRYVRAHTHTQSWGDTI